MASSHFTSAEEPAAPTSDEQPAHSEDPDENSGPGGPQPHTDKPAVPGEPPNTSDD